MAPLLDGSHGARRRPVPEGAHYWDFDCKLGATEEVATAVPLGDLIGAVDALAKDGADSFYVEILERAAVRKPRPPVAEPVPPATAVD